MSLKSKKMRKIARTAAMSALIVSAIVGTGVVASAATTDNVSNVAAGQTLVVTDANTNPTAGTLNASGTVYVGTTKTANTTTNSGFSIVGNANVTGGKVFIGQSGATTAVNNAIMTADNVTITSGGQVSVNNNSLLVAAKNININSGTLYMGGTYSAPGVTVKDSGSLVMADKVNIGAAGTLEVTHGQKNVVAATEVNLNGGKLLVSSKAHGGDGAGLTIVGKSKVTMTGGGWVENDWQGKADAAAVKGHVVVADDGKLNSYGGTIGAGVIVKGSAATAGNFGAVNFKSGTTTVDNLTVSSNGSATIEGGATVNSKQDVTIDGASAVLTMKGGTLRVLDPAGAVNVSNSGELLASAGVNTVDANVKVTSSGKVNVTSAASLTITKGLTTNGGTVNVGATASGGLTAKLTVNGALTLTAGSIQVGNKSDMTSKGILSVGYNAIKADTVATGAISLGSGTATNGANTNNSGTLILTGYAGKTFEAVGTNADRDTITGKTAGGVLADDYAKNNIVIWGANLTDNGETIAAESNGSTAVTAGVNVKITAAAGTTPTLSAAIIAPSVSTTTGDLKMTSGGAVSLLGLGMGNAANLVTSLGALDMGTGSKFAVNDGATLITKTLKMDGGKMDVLNATANLGILEAVSGTIFVDPAIVNIAGLKDNNLGNVGLMSSAGSIVTLGGNTGWMAKPMADAGFAFNNANQSTLGIAVSDTITVGATGVIAVDPTIVANAAGTGYELTFTKADGTTETKAVDRATVGAFWAGNNTLTVLDVSGLAKDEAVFNLATGSAQDVNIVNGAKLHVANLTVNGVTIFENTATGGSVVVKDGSGTVYNPDAVGAGWAGKNLIQPDRMLNAKMTAGGLLDADVNLASHALGMSGEFESMMQGVWGNALNNTNSPNAGIRLVSRAASTDFGLSADQAAKTIEGAAQLGAVAGVQGVTIGAANAATSAVATRTSFAQPLLDKTKAVAMNLDSEGHVTVDSGLNAGNGMKNGLALWIMPLYQSNNVWGQKAGNFKSGYNSDLGGVAAGVDYTLNEMFRFGAALNIGAGYSQSSGDFNSTDNSFNFWGVNLYGGWNMNNFGVTADVGYTGNYNKVEQDAPVSLGMSNFKSDINSSAWTAGLKAEYKIETSVMDIIPHVGVRYMGLTTDQYDVKAGGGTVFEVEQNFQSIWTFPIGVALSKNIETGSGWVFKPQLDLSVIPAAGDVEAKSKSRIPGAPGTADAKMQVVDYVTFDGGLGFDIGNDNLSFGLNYNIQASEHRTGHGVFGTVRYEF